VVHCRHCATPLPPYAAVCPTCGAPAGAGTSYCPVCAAATHPAAVVCLRCGAGLRPPGTRSKLVAGLLVVTIVTCGIGGLWGFIEGILILTGNIDRDADGMPLTD
jgi:Double zinc ribbon